MRNAGTFNYEREMELAARSYFLHNHLLPRMRQSTLHGLPLYSVGRETSVASYSTAPEPISMIETASRIAADMYKGWDHATYGGLSSLETKDSRV